MTKQEAIDVLKMDCELILLDLNTVESLDPETVKARNDLNYKCYLANWVAIACLQEGIEREKGCEECTIVRNGKTLFKGSGMMWGYECCPHCGRELKGADNDKGSCD